MHQVRKSLQDEVTILNTEIEKLLTNITNLSGVWVGYDAELFCTKASEYVNNMKQVSSCVSTLGDVIDKSMVVYKEKDSNWKKELRKEVEKDEGC